MVAGVQATLSGTPPGRGQTGHPPTGDVSLREKFSTKGAAHVFFLLEQKGAANDLPHVPQNNVFELRGLEKKLIIYLAIG